MSGLTPQSLVTSASGQSMPIFGLGTWQNTGADLEMAFDTAVEAGYRLINTAYSYKNEEVIGKVLARWFASGKLSRQDIFITTKVTVYPIQHILERHNERYNDKTINIDQ